MNPNITLGEVKALCAELAERYGDEECCDHCKFDDCGCLETPEGWKLDSDTSFDTEVVCDDDRMTVRKLMAYLSLCNPDFPVYFEENKIEFITEHRDIVNPEQSFVNLI